MISGAKKAELLIDNPNPYYYNQVLSISISENIICVFVVDENYSQYRFFIVDLRNNSVVSQSDFRIMTYSTFCSAVYYGGHIYVLIDNNTCDIYSITNNQPQYVTSVEVDPINWGAKYFFIDAVNATLYSVGYYDISAFLLTNPLLPNLISYFLFSELLYCDLATYNSGRIYISLTDGSINSTRTISIFDVTGDIVFIDTLSLPNNLTSDLFFVTNGFLFSFGNYLEVFNVRNVPNFLVSSATIPIGPKGVISQFTSCAMFSDSFIFLMDYPNDTLHVVDIKNINEIVFNNVYIGADGGVL